MRVYGEAFLFINGWMNFLSLLLAARLGRRRFSWGRALAASALGAGYALMAWTGNRSWLRGPLALVIAGFLMALIAFGSRGGGMLPLLLAAGWLFYGLADFARKNGAAPGWILGGSTGAALLIGLCCRGVKGKSGTACELTLRLGKRRLTVPALKDTGNLLVEGVSGLPVIVLPEALARPLMPSSARAGDLSTLPAGWRLIRARTAAGERTLMCFYPDEVLVRQGRKVWRADAAAAVSDFRGKSALLPAGLFTDCKEEMKHAGA